MRGLVAPNGVSPFAEFICQAPSHPDVVYALAGLGGADTAFNEMFSSDDFGETWTRRGVVDTEFGFNSCAVDAADPRTVIACASDATFASKSRK
jgi:hypothetical protein